MSYLLDKKLQKKRNSIVIFFIVAAVLFYFRGGVIYGLSYATSTVFRPFLVLKNSASSKLGSLSMYFASKNSLTKDLEDSKNKLAESEAKMANYNTVVDENESLKEILGRKDEKKPMLLAVVLGKANQSLYDTLIVDAGEVQGVVAGAKVFALGNIPIGYVEVAYQNSSKVILFSNSEERTTINLKETLFDLVGRGGGNFELTLPRDFIIEEGEQAVLPGITPYTVAVVETIISDPRDSFKKALLVSPLNIGSLKFVQVEK